MPTSARNAKRPLVAGAVVAKGRLYRRPRAAARRRPPLQQTGRRRCGTACRPGLWPGRSRRGHVEGDSLVQVAGLDAQTGGAAGLRHHQNPLLVQHILQHPSPDQRLLFHKAEVPGPGKRQILGAADAATVYFLQAAAGFAVIHRRSPFHKDFIFMIPSSRTAVKRGPSGCAAVHIPESQSVRSTGSSNFYGFFRPPSGC